MSDIGLTITIRGTDAVLAKLAKKPAQLRRAIGLGLRDGALLVLRRASENLTGKVLNVQTGRLRQSLQLFSRPDEGIAGVGTNVVYASIHEYGGRTRAHLIEPVNRLALRMVARNFVGPLRRTKKGKLFKRQSAGAFIFRETVHHPGSVMPARPYLRPALRESVPEIQAGIERQIGLILQESP